MKMKIEQYYKIKDLPFNKFFWYYDFNKSELSFLW